MILIMRGCLHILQILENANFVFHDAAVLFGLDAIDEVVEDDLHGALPLLLRVLIDGSLDDMLLHHFDCGGDGIKGNDGERFFLVQVEHSPADTVSTAGRYDEKSIDFSISYRFNAPPGPGTGEGEGAEAAGT